MTEPETFTADQYRTAATACIDLFEAASRVEVTSANQQRFLAIHGLVATTFAQIKATMLCIDAGIPAAAAPNVRSALEHAITIQWLHRQKGAVDDFINRAQQKTNIMLKTGLSLGWPVPQELRDRMDEAIPKVDGRIGNFEQMCREFDPTDGLYLWYRSLSNQTHPTLEGSSQYLHGNDLRKMNLLKTARTDDTYSFIWTCAFSAILALAVREDMVRYKPNKSKVKRIAASVQMPTFPETLSHPGKAKSRKK